MDQEEASLLSGSRREIPIFAIGFIVLALISAGYFDETPTLIFAFFGALLLTYYFLNPGKSSSPPG
jgi:uncharacterized membrane protein YadS